MPADTATADAFAAGQREAREGDRVALVTALGMDAATTWERALSYATRHAEDNTDPTLQGMCRTSNAWMQAAAMHARNEDYYRGLLAACAVHLGPDVYRQDDGGIVIDPLLAKVPELVAAMREHIATLGATLRDLRAQLDYIAHVGWDASCESAAADTLEAEDATRLNRYAVRVAGERDEARAAALHEAVAVLRGLSDDYAAGHRDHYDYCRALSVAAGRIEALTTTTARESAARVDDVEGDL